MSEDFQTQKNLKQLDCLACILFYFNLDSAVKRSSTLIGGSEWLNI